MKKILIGLAGAAACITLGAVFSPLKTSHADTATTSNDSCLDVRGACPTPDPAAAVAPVTPTETLPQPLATATQPTPTDPTPTTCQ